MLVIRGGVAAASMLLLAARISYFRKFYILRSLVMREDSHKPAETFDSDRQLNITSSTLKLNFYMKWPITKLPQLLAVLQRREGHDCKTWKEEPEMLQFQRNYNIL